MFAVLKIKEEKKSLLERLSERVYPPEVICETVKVKNGAPFFVITAPLKRKKIPWSEISYAAGKCALRMFLPPNITPPQESLVKEFVPSNALKVQMMFNTAYKVLKMAELDPVHTSLCIIDRNAEVADKIKKLIQFAGTVNVVSDKTEEYERVSGDIMKKYGASIFLTKDINAIKTADIIITTSEEVLKNSHTSFVFTLYKNEKLKKCIIPPKILLPKEYESIRQEEVDDEALACALYDLCGIKTLGDNVFGSLLFNGEEKNLYKLAQEMINT